MNKMLGKTGQGGQRTCYCCSDTHKQARRREELSWQQEAIEGMIDRIEEKKAEKHKGFFKNWDLYEKNARDEAENPEGYSKYTTESEPQPGSGRKERNE